MPAKKTDEPTTTPESPVPASPPAGVTFPVRVTDRGDGWTVGDRRLSGGETLDLPQAEARDLVRGGFAGWTTRVRALKDNVVTTTDVLAKGQTATCPPDEAERLAKSGAVEVVKGEGE